MFLVYGSGPPGMFPELPFNDEQRKEYCSTLYGKDVDRHIWFGLDYFGSSDASQVSSNIIWSNAQQDPLYAAGVKNSAESINYDGTVSLDLLTPSDGDGMDEVRTQEADMIEQFIDESLQK